MVSSTCLVSSTQRDNRTPVPGDSASLSDLSGTRHTTVHRHTFRQNTLRHKINLFKKKVARHGGTRLELILALERQRQSDLCDF